MKWFRFGWASGEMRKPRKWIAKRKRYDHEESRPDCFSWRSWRSRRSRHATRPYRSRVQVARRRSSHIPKAPNPCRPCGSKARKSSGAGAERSPAITQSFDEPSCASRDPYGTDRVIIIEVRPSAGADVDWYGSRNRSAINAANTNDPHPHGAHHATPTRTSKKAKADDRGRHCDPCRRSRRQKDVEVILTADVRA